MTKPQRQFLLLVAIFALPIIAGWILISNPSLLPQIRSNNGMLINPPTLSPDFEFIQADNKTLKSSSAHSEFWTLIIDAGESCVEKCQKKLYDLGIIRKALKQDYSRVKRLLILENDSESAQFPSLLKGNSDLGILVDKEQVFASLYEKHNLENNTEKYNIFIMDPSRRIMMAYSDANTTKDILADMQRLLTVNR